MHPSKLEVLRLRDRAHGLGRGAGRDRDPELRIEDAVVVFSCVCASTPGESRTSTGAVVPARAAAASSKLSS